MSGAGKSVLAAALCRIFREDGFRVAPFKSQNMALNSYITEDGLEMGRAQAVQAFAAGLKPDVRMNPVLLKPSSDTGSQLIVMGEVRGDYRARDYFKMKHTLKGDIMDAFNSLAAENDIIVIEGAGSPAEINLKDDDIVNMGMAKMADCPVLLAGNIDCGGVFAQLYGTVKLLEKEEQDRIIGLIINKFRGDVSILEPGLKMLEDRAGKPVLGVVPYLNVDIDDEDSLSERLNEEKAHAAVDIAVIRLPKLSNFTDFIPLERHEAMGVRYVKDARDLGEPDLIILPGTKSTMADLKWMRSSGMETAVQKRAAKGTPVIGICGGFQMLGKTLSDPDNVEGGGEMRGLGLLDTETVFEKSKARTQISGTVSGGPFKGTPVSGYEIHMGRTQGGEGFVSLEDGRTDGALKENVFGSYLHGIFDSGELTDALASYLLSRKGLNPEDFSTISHAEYQEQQFKVLADGVREALDIKRLYEEMDRFYG